MASRSGGMYGGRVDPGGKANRRPFGGTNIHPRSRVEARPDVPNGRGAGRGYFRRRRHRR